MAHRIATDVPAMDEWVCERRDGKEERESKRGEAEKEGILWDM